MMSNRVKWFCMVILMQACFEIGNCAETAREHSDFHAWATIPPMGWNSWDCFGCTATEQEVKENAVYMAKHLKSFGWQYVVVDIQWYEPQSNKDRRRSGPYDYPRRPQSNIDEYGRLWPALIKHPSSADGKGFKPLSDFVHGLGLKFGVHLMRGIPRRAVEENTLISGTDRHARDVADTSSTCPWNPDMYGVDMSKPGAQAYYNSVFDLFSSWGVDYVKVDDISRPYDAVQKGEIGAIRKAIDRTNRPMVLSLSPGETPLSAGPHVYRHANLWRISDDFWDDWRALKSQFKRLDDWTQWRGDGFYPDADMLPLGNIHAREERGWTRFTQDEQKTMMSLWAITRSPLMMGGHMPNNDSYTLELLTNPEVLAVNQYSMDNRQLFRREDLIAWAARDRKSDDVYIALFNAQDEHMDIDRSIWKSPILTRRSAKKYVRLDLDVKDAQKLYLVVDDTGDGYAWDHADWLSPTLVLRDGKTLSLMELKWDNATVGWGVLRPNRSISGNPLSVDGQIYSKGIGAHSNSIIEYTLPKESMRFEAIAALDDAAANQHGQGGTIQFMVFTQNPMAPIGERSEITVSLNDLGFSCPCNIRDLWNREDIGVSENSFSTTLGRHCSGLYRISPTKD